MKLRTSSTLLSLILLIGLLVPPSASASTLADELLAIPVGQKTNCKSLPIGGSAFLFFASAGACDQGGLYYDMCEGVGLTMWDTCRAAGGSKAQCEADAQLAQNNCMRDFGCPPIIF